MESHKLIPDVTFHLVHSFYRLIDFEFNTDVGSTNKRESNYTSGNILDELSKLLNDYSKYINGLESRDSTVESGKQTYTNSVIPNYKFALKDAHDRLPEAEYNFRVDEPVYNGILVLLQYLSPNNFIWHYHKDEERHIRFCCVYSSVLFKDFLTHYHVVSKMKRFQVLRLVDLDVLENVCESLINTRLSKNSDVILRRVNGIVSMIHLPLKNNLSKTRYIDTVLEFECSKDGCSYVNPVYVNIELYNKANSHYNLFPTPCKLAAIVLLDKVPNGDFKNYNFLISTLLIIYNSTHGQILDDIYEVVLNILDKHPNAFLDISNVLLFKEVVKKMSDDINNYNNSVLKCTECFVKLTSALFDDNDVKIYELLESTIDRMKMMNNRELKNKFIGMYDHYLKNVPLACAATMLQMIQLIMGALDTLDGESILVSVKCLESMFTHLPKDSVYYFKDVYGRFLIIHFVFLSNEDKSRDSLENMLKYEFFSELIVKVCIYSEGKVGNDLENREEVINTIANIFKIVKNTLEDLVFKNITHKIKNELSSDVNISDHTLDELDKFYEMFDL